MNDTGTHRNQVVAVTGASGGIGRATAVAFGRRGAKVALLARGTAGLAAAADEVRAAGGHPLVVEVDVFDGSSARTSFSRSSCVVPAGRVSHNAGQAGLPATNGSNATIAPAVRFWSDWPMSVTLGTSIPVPPIPPVGVSNRLL